jgi:uncharacterized protein YwgA
MQFDRDKFKALLHYVVWSVGVRQGFGAARLYKVLWFSDADAHARFDEPITGESYVREKYGPFPRHVLPVIQELIDDGSIRCRNGSYFNMPIQYFYSLKNPDKLSPNPLHKEIVEHWIKIISNEHHRATSISTETYDYAWKMADIGEELPYHAIFANSIRDPEGKELEWVLKRAQELRLA